MNIYTTCRDCGGLLPTLDGDHTVHPECTPRPTRIETLTQQWLSAVENGDTHLEATLDAAITAYDHAAPPRLGAAALIYADWGWPVFPLKAHSKQPATRHGFKNATTDRDRIAAYWKRKPDANIGLATGRAFDVIDIDPPEGTASYLALRAGDDDIFPDIHGQVTTAHGGIHFYVEPSGKGNKAGIRPGIDHRGIGGYVVAPPSTLGDRGRSWSWAVAPSPTITATQAGHQ